MRILSTELRRSAALTAGALVTALGIAGLYLLLMSGQSGLWDPQWTMLAAFGRIMLVVLWPLVLGAGAWQARRDRRARIEELVVTTARPVWRRVLPASAAIAILLALGYGLVTVAGAVRVVGKTDYTHLSWLPITLVGALSLIAAGLLGLGLGLLVPSVYTPPALVVAGLLVLIMPVELSKSGPLGPVALLAPNLTTTIDEFTTIDGAVSLAQLVWFTALALSGLLLTMFARRIAAALAVVPALLGLVVAVPLLNAAPASGLVADPDAVAEVCTTDGGPAVCVTKAHEQGLRALTGPARRALTLLAKLPAAPTSVHEVTGGRPGPQPADQVWLHADNYQPGHGWRAETNDELVVRILAGAGTRLCKADDYRARALTSAWLYGQYPAPGPKVFGEEAAARDAAWQSLRALPAAGQLRRIAAVRQAGLTCDVDLTSALTGGWR